VGYDIDDLNSLRKALPKLKCGIDLNVPEESSIILCLKKLPSAPLKYAALYNLLLDSGLRVIEAVKVIAEFKGAEKINGFYRIAVGLFRGSKQAYFAYFTEPTYNRLVSLETRDIKPLTASHYYDKCGYISPKYLRKFSFDKMIGLEVPESVADFIEGRVPKRIGAKHYMVLRRQADNFYGKYAEYLHSLRTTISA
jgi:intergrase/recombinase